MVIEVQEGAPEPVPAESDVVLVVDLDGTLILTDTLHEGLVKLLKDRPFDMLRLPAWLSAGKAHFKREVATRAPLDVTLLPYNETVLDHVRAARAAGRRTVLATASDVSVARAIAEYLGLFDEVIASEAGNNLSGAHKRNALVERFGVGGFDYVANAAVDKPIWSAARNAILVNAPPALASDIKNTKEHVEILTKKENFRASLNEAARVYQWVKNILIFVPILAAQQFSGASLLHASLAFLFFSLAASSVYLINDLMDLEADRRHPRKKQRPFASGRLALLPGFLTAVLLGFVSLVGAFLVGVEFGLVLIAYLIVTGAYSLWIKRQPLVDIIVLAGLYTLRIVAGGAATDTPLTLWLLAFSMFLFASLAFAKRYAEVADVFGRGESDVGGRGYRAGDQNVLMALGTAAGVASIVTLALFVNNPTDPDLYGTPQMLWGVCPVLLYWVAHIWLTAQRGALTDDPIVFAITDRSSQAALVIALIPVALAIWL
ncbi:MAG: 4-hydroxybenzoate polyprenyltransferase/phosphoserine phosphatase [Alphaproteobacteria bacterium]|jgi:4-hydroxybenzoate polyprenyltransferase/phosphoserine phosphatase